MPMINVVNYRLQSMIIRERERGRWGKQNAKYYRIPVERKEMVAKYFKGVSWRYEKT